MSRSGGSVPELVVVIFELKLKSLQTKGVGKWPIHEGT